MSIKLIKKINYIFRTDIFTINIVFKGNIEPYGKGEHFMNQVTVFAKLKSKENKLEKTKELLSGLIEPTKREQGCIIYDLHQDQGDPLNFYFYEVWENKSLLDAHLNSPHVQHLFDRQKELLDKEIEVGFAEKVILD